jgi:hypothetical protein
LPSFPVLRCSMLKAYSADHFPFLSFTVSPA